MKYHKNFLFLTSTKIFQDQINKQSFVNRICDVYVYKIM